MASSKSSQGAAVEAVARAAVPLSGGDGDYDELMDLVGDARLVLLGEASHGTHEFYRERARITRRLVEEKQFDAVAVEADWPDAYRVNCFVTGGGGDETASEALADFRRFPTWMWRNADVLDFVGWMREHNSHLHTREHHVGFYGLDLYSLRRSADAVLHYLDRTDPAAAGRARERYACLDHAGEDGSAYGWSAAFGAGPTCERQVLDQLIELCRRSAHGVDEDDDDARFFAEQNARLVVGAEAYYRTMFEGRVSSWNVRDCHMADTLDTLASHLSRRLGRPAKVAVWAHNSHLGDARATELGWEAGELNLGQLARERHGDDVVLIGFTTYTGTVTAADDWGSPGRRKQVRPALPQSHEDVFHSVGEPNFLLPVRRVGNGAFALRQPRLERAIGVIYRPGTERISHYFQARLAEQFDAVIHLDQTRAVEPLEPTADWRQGEVPETFPTAL